MMRNPIADKQKPMSLIEIHEAKPDECGLSQEELNDRFGQEVDRLNEVLLSYLPELHRRLQLSHGEALQQWIDTDDFQAAQLKTQNFNKLVKDIRKAVANSDWLYLDLDSWEGLLPLTPVTEAVLEEIKAFAGRLLKQNARPMVRELIGEILHSQDKDSFRVPDKSRFNSLEHKDNAAFFIFGLMHNQKVAQELQALWVLNTCYDAHSEMLLIVDEPYLYFSKTWNHCRDILPGEIIELLDSKYGNGEEGAPDEAQ
jgi:hypothetical protein